MFLKGSGRHGKITHSEMTEPLFSLWSLMVTATGVVVEVAMGATAVTLGKTLIHIITQLSQNVYIL